MSLSRQVQGTAQRGYERFERQLGCLVRTNSETLLEDTDGLLRPPAPPLLRPLWKGGRRNPFLVWQLAAIGFD